MLDFYEVEFKNGEIKNVSREKCIELKEKYSFTLFKEYVPKIHAHRFEWVPITQFDPLAMFDDYKTCLG